MCLRVPGDSVKVSIDEAACQGTGYCVRVAPDLFELGGAVVSVKVDTVPVHLEDAAREAEVLCPARAILLAD